MGKFKVIISDNAKKDLLSIQKSGDKASIKKIELLLPNYIHIQKQAQANPKD